MKWLLTEWVWTDCLLIDALMSRRLSQRSSDVDSCCICRVVAAKCSLTRLTYGSALKELTCRFFTSQPHSCWIYRPPSCSSEALCCKIKQISTDSQGNHCKTLTLRNLIIYTSTPQWSVRPGQALELMRWEWEAFEKCTWVSLNAKATSESWPCDYSLCALLNQLHLLLKDIQFSL